MNLHIPAILKNPKTILGIGLSVSIASYLTWSATGSTLAGAVLILAGSFTLPATILVWLHGRFTSVPAAMLANCFMVGGAIGLVLSGFLELSVPLQRTFSGYIGVGLIEESTKLVFPVALFLGWRYRSLAHGLLIGVAVGMGFAVLETVGRGMSDLINHTQNVGYTMLTRGFFTPAGHPAWTGLICAILWKAKINPKTTFGLIVLGTFVMAVVMHATWDTINKINVPDIVTAAMLMVLSCGILWLVFLQFEQAEKERDGV